MQLVAIKEPHLGDSKLLKIAFDAFCKVTDRMLRVRNRFAVVKISEVLLLSQPQIQVFGREENAVLLVPRALPIEQKENHKYLN